MRLRSVVVEVATTGGLLGRRSEPLSTSLHAITACSTSSDPNIADAMLTSVWLLADPVLFPSIGQAYVLARQL